VPVEDELAALRDENKKLTDEREQYRELYMAMVERCRKLELGLLGQKSERLSPADAQLTMAVLATMLGERSFAAASELEEAVEQKVREHTRAKPTGRKPLPENLPRVEIEVVPEDVERQGRDAFEKIGEELTETVERRPASLVVVRVRKPKFVRKDRERNAETKVYVAPSPELPIERGLAGPALLADTIVHRWQDHLPLYRLEQVYAREGLELARSTICGWHAELAELCRPLVEAMWLDARGSPYLCTDATGVLVQAKEKCRNGHFWVVVAPGRHVLYRYSAKHDSAAVDQMLAGYKGYLVADAHAVYDHLYKSGDVVEVGCWAHQRRYAYKALESEPERAKEALALIGELFRIERTIADVPTRKREVVRERESRPVVERFFAWCDAQAERVLDGTPMAALVGYARNQRVALSRFLDDGQLPICNNISENALRREVKGRDNWLFVGSDDAADVNTTFVSLLASCQMHGIEPCGYLRDLFCLLPSWPARRVFELAPIHWNETREHEDAQQRLAANLYRRASLGELDEHRPEQVAPPPPAVTT
jgi:transposase